MVVGLILCLWFVGSLLSWTAFKKKYAELRKGLKWYERRDFDSYIIFYSLVGSWITWWKVKTGKW